jgi:hypothetical protein
VSIHVDWTRTFRDQRPRLRPRALEERWLKRRCVVEVAAPLGLPLTPGKALAVAALGAAFDLGGGPLEAGPDLVGL